MMLNNTKYAKTQRIGTPLYLSPDIIKHESYDHRTDIWSLGVVMYHMATLEFPFMDSNMNGLIKQILYKTPKLFAACYSTNLKDFIFSMLEKNKGKRPFIIDLFKYFPHNNYRIRNPIDTNNYELYS
jgi:NIMA (never in mitosis gene a)-related kinase